MKITKREETAVRIIHKRQGNRKDKRTVMEDGKIMRQRSQKPL